MTPCWFAKTICLDPDLAFMTAILSLSERGQCSVISGLNVFFFSPTGGKSVPERNIWMGWGGKCQPLCFVNYITVHSEPLWES